jgi:integrase
MKKAAERHLWNRGVSNRQNWYLRLPIPKPLRKHFARTKGGSEPLSIIEPLDTGDLAVARRKRDELTVAYRRVFDRLEAGEAMTPEEIKAAASLDLGAVVERARSGMLAALRPTDEARRQQEEWAELLEPQWAELDAGLQAELDADVAAVAEREGVSIERGSPLWKAVRDSIARGKRAAMRDYLRPPTAPEAERSATVPPPVVPVVPAPPVDGETISQAASAWFDEMQRDPTAAVKATTLDGHRLRVRALVDHCGDVPLANVTRAMAADFLVKIATRGLSNRTVNNYATTLASVFKSTRYRGRFTGDNPFEGQKRKAGGESYSPFTVAELQTLFDSFQPETRPTEHSPETALPWASLIAAFTGMRLEEIAQLSAADIREQGANGATVTVIDIHNGGNNALKNKASARLVPIHSELVGAGLLRYRDALPKNGPLFPGLVRRASKGGKIGARVGELFRDKLEALGLKRDRLCFHSFRHTVAGRLEAAAVSDTDTARVLGHAVKGMSFGVYSSGPGLKRLAAVVEEIEYPGLKIPAAK